MNPSRLMSTNSKWESARENLGSMRMISHFTFEVFRAWLKVHQAVAFDSDHEGKSPLKDGAEIPERGPDGHYQDRVRLISSKAYVDKAPPVYQ